jgi:hypothetical protein
MATGTNSSSQKTFLNVAYGKLRQKSLENKEKVNANTPNAVKRISQSGTDSWAIEFDWIEGKIENIFHKDDPEYGDSFEVVLSDVLDKYQISFADNSRFWFDLAKKLPNVELSQIVKINPYDFTEKGTNKRRVGVSIEQNGKKILSFYDKKKDDNTWELLHGFPKPDIDINWKDKDEVKIYTIKVKKFLKAEFEKRIQPLFGQPAKEHIEENNQDDIPAGAIDDLPF